MSDDDSFPKGSVAELFILMIKQARLRHELKILNTRITEISGRGKGKRKPESRFEQQILYEELDQLIKALPKGYRQKNLIIEYFTDKYQAEGKCDARKLAEGHYSKFLRGLNRHRRRLK